MMIYIDQDTGKMVNIYTPYKAFSRLTTPESRAAAGVVGIEEDPAPEDFSYDTHERKEHWEATQRPYITYPNKPAEEVQRIKIAQVTGEVFLQQGFTVLFLGREVVIERPLGHAGRA